jgi:hypothetical protein
MPKYRRRIPLSDALKAYWPWLSGLVLSSAVLCSWQSVSKKPAIIALLFFPSAFAAMWPWLAKDTPYSFWIFACLLWFLSPFVYGLIAIAFR